MAPARRECGLFAFEGVTHSTLATSPLRRALEKKEALFHKREEEPGEEREGKHTTGEEKKESGHSAQILNLCSIKE